MDRVIRRLIKGKASPEDGPEFVRLIQQERCTDALKTLLPVLYADFGGVILGRLAELVPQEDPKLYLSLALWNFRNGLDEDASQFLEKARSLAPFDQETLRFDLWLSVANGEDEASEKCRTLLQMYPNDGWATQLCKVIAEEGPPRSIESPRWDNPWEELINGQRVA